MKDNDGAYNFFMKCVYIIIDSYSFYGLDLSLFLFYLFISLCSGESIVTSDDDNDYFFFWCCVNNIFTSKTFCDD